MNHIRNLSESLLHTPQLPKIKARSEVLIEELRLRLAQLDKQKSPEQIVELVATVAGVARRVRRIALVERDILSLETYEDLGISITVTPIELMAVTIQVLSKSDPRARPFDGINACSRPTDGS